MLLFFLTVTIICHLIMTHRVNENFKNCTDTSTDCVFPVTVFLKFAVFAVNLILSQS